MVDHNPIQLYLLPFFVNLLETEVRNSFQKPSALLLGVGDQETVYGLKFPLETALKPGCHSAFTLDWLKYRTWTLEVLILKVIIYIYQLQLVLHLLEDELSSRSTSSPTVF